MRASVIILVLIFGIQGILPAAEIVITGVYQGKDIFVQNPYSQEDKLFCTKAVFVNSSEVISNPKASAFKIDLSHLRVNDPVEIKIVYKENCIPRLLNPEVIKKSSGFEFTDATVSRTGLKWMAKGELPGGEYIVERKLPDTDWKDIKLIPGEGNMSGRYQIPVDHSGGDNFYRIRFEGPDGKHFHSTIVNFDFKEEPVTFSPVDPTIRISLSRTTEYLITDKDGNKYLEGKNDFINVKNLPSGEYILHIQNRKENFVIKRELKPIKRDQKTAKKRKSDVG